jgi:hypothetical protein
VCVSSRSSTNAQLGVGDWTITSTVKLLKQKLQKKKKHETKAQLTLFVIQGAENEKIFAANPHANDMPDTQS